MARNAPAPDLVGPPAPQRSRWLWWVWLGMGIFSFVGFLVAAARIPKRRFVRAAIFAFLACAIGLAAYALWPPVVIPGPHAAKDPSDETITSANGIWIVMAIWTLLIAYGHFLNVEYKQFLIADDAERQAQWERRHALYQSTAAAATPAAFRSPYPATAAPRSSEPNLDQLIAQADKYLESQPPGNTPDTGPPNVPAD